MTGRRSQIKYNDFCGERERPNRLIPVLLLFFILTLLSPLTGICNDRYAYLEKRIVGFISDYYGQKNDIHIKLNSQSSVLRDESLRLKDINFAKLPDSNGNGICSIEVEDKRRTVRNVLVAFKVMNRKKIYVLKENMNKGEIITADKVTVKEIILNEDKRIYPSDTEDVVGKLLKRDLNAGTAITKDVLEDHFIIKRNDIVSIIIEQKRLLVKAKGRAIDRGKIGDVIRVKNLTSQKEVLGRITGSGTVNVEM
ncbi:MAG: flagellar basal body P-ring formation chaperone FlgA [Syntrophorhabdaceae bacterium]|nr:flagellar basal body P-ring formation chaperone FlgA [Syntrophorhabdaceae bacterium]